MMMPGPQSRLIAGQPQDPRDRSPRPLYSVAAQRTEAPQTPDGNTFYFQQTGGDAYHGFVPRSGDSVGHLTRQVDQHLEECVQQQVQLQLGDALSEVQTYLEQLAQERLQDQGLVEEMRQQLEDQKVTAVEVAQRSATAALMGFEEITKSTAAAAAQLEAELNQVRFFCDSAREMAQTQVTTFRMDLESLHTRHQEEITKLSSALSPDSVARAEEDRETRLSDLERSLAALLEDAAAQREQRQLQQSALEEVHSLLISSATNPSKAELVDSIEALASSLSTTEQALRKELGEVSVSNREQIEQVMQIVLSNTFSPEEKTAILGLLPAVEQCLRELSELAEKQKHEVFEIFFDAPFDEIDHGAFKVDLLASFKALGACDDTLALVSVKLRAGSVVAVVCGPPAAILELKGLDIERLSVAGFLARRDQCRATVLNPEVLPSEDLQTIRSQLEALSAEVIAPGALSSRVFGLSARIDEAEAKSELLACQLQELKGSSERQGQTTPERQGQTTPITIDVLDEIEGRQQTFASPLLEGWQSELPDADFGRDSAELQQAQQESLPTSNVEFEPSVSTEVESLGEIPTNVVAPELVILSGTVASETLPLQLAADAEPTRMFDSSPRDAQDSNEPSVVIEMAPAVIPDAFERDDSFAVPVEVDGNSTAALAPGENLKSACPPQSLQPYDPGVQDDPNSCSNSTMPEAPLTAQVHTTDGGRYDERGVSQSETSIHIPAEVIQSSIPQSSEIPVAFIAQPMAVEVQITPPLLAQAGTPGSVGTAPVVETQQHQLSPSTIQPRAVPAFESVPQGHGPSITQLQPSTLAELTPQQFSSMQQHQSATTTEFVPQLSDPSIMEPQTLTPVLNEFIMQQASALFASEPAALSTAQQVDLARAMPGQQALPCDFAAALAATAPAAPVPAAQAPVAVPPAAQDPATLVSAAPAPEPTDPRAATKAQPDLTALARSLSQFARAVPAATAAPSQLLLAPSPQTEPIARGRSLNPFARPVMHSQQLQQTAQAELAQRQQVSVIGMPEALDGGPQPGDHPSRMPTLPLAPGIRPEKPVGALPRSISNEGPCVMNPQGGAPVRREMTWTPGSLGGGCGGGSGQILPGQNLSGQPSGACVSGRPMFNPQPVIPSRGYEGPSPGRGYERPSPRQGEQSHSPIRSRYLPQSPVSPLRPAVQNASSLSAPGPPGVPLAQAPVSFAMPEWSFGYQQYAPSGGVGNSRPRSYSPVNARC